ncbi:high nitrogen upregulated cytochrome P450 monooxygenase 2 [Athelia psychrophila]|uniref:High nitrogen upregulated cytochrome P450 monooxygenase 2 n=1 Tax=Athelia psychrophila TaxID=1759441 RepID=A0A166IWE4_9AGAM|nr:high nitrogen upregulated cytochrome P450 monooxygenase 2 [Fibularhizoctonia sp. CBS 109695]
MASTVASDFTSISIAVVSTFFVYFGSIMLLAAGYRLSVLHPLANYPGPISNRLSSFWIVWVSSRGKKHRYYQELHGIYGDFVRTGPNELSVCDAQAIQDVLGAPGLPKGPAWDNRHPAGEVRPLIELRDPIEHAQRRKPWARALNSSGLKTFEPVVVDRVRELMKQLALASEAIDEVDLAMWMKAFSFDFMGSMAFDTDFEFMKRGGDTESIWPIFEDGMKCVSVGSYISWLLPTVHALLPMNYFNQRGVQITKKWVGERGQRGSSIKDLFYHLINEDGLESERPPLEAVASEGILAVIAGSDITATTLTALFYYLLKNAEKLSKLRAEIDSHFARDEEPVDFGILAGMEYLNACINEALRLYPAVMSGSQRQVPRGSGGKMIGSRFVPEGTSILIHTFSIHRDLRNFSHPDSFLPERWLVDCRPGDMKHNPEAFIPFSFGPQNCVGKNLAIMELRAVVASIVQRLHMSTTAGSGLEQWEGDVEDWFVTLLPPLPVRLQVRQPLQRFL